MKVFFAFAVSFDTSSADVTPRVVRTAQAISDFIKPLHQNFGPVYRYEHLSSSTRQRGQGAPLKPFDTRAWGRLLSLLWTH